jgi:predicted aspartyl protease
MLGKTLSAAAAAVLVATCSPAAAQDKCELVLQTGLESTLDFAGNPKVPVTIAEHSLAMLVDTGGNYSMLKKKWVTELGLVQTRVHGGRFDAGGRPIYYFVKVTDFQFGRMFARSTRMLVMPDDLGAADVDGTLAPDFLSRFDIEFDFAHSKINLFSPNNCASSPVYWASRHAEVQLGTNGWKQIFTTVNLDGKNLTAQIDTGSSTSFVYLDAAQDLLGLKMDDPTLKRLIDEAGKSYGYSYPLKALSFGTIVVRTPTIRVAEEVRGLHASHMVIGMDLLRSLRLYISYKDSKIYATTAAASQAAN